MSPVRVVGGTYSASYWEPGYASGFQVGLGFNMPGMDNWNLSAEYTWYQNSDTVSVSNDSSHVFRVANIPVDFGAHYYFNGTLVAKTKMHFDALDVLLKRPFYFGKKLTANFAAGLSTLWITQNFSKDLNGLAGASRSTATLPTVAAFSMHQTSWGLGPKFGFETNWMLGYGLQIMADLSASMLYTRYEVTGKSSATFNGIFSSTSITALDGYGTIRPVTEAFLGMGWGTGLFDDNYRIALSAGYDFKGYWFYNMKDYQNNEVSGNMYLQGLNVSARFDF